MPSLRAKFFNLATRLLVRRRRWGSDEFALAEKARGVFGSPKILQWISAAGFEVEPVNGNVHGEWIVPKRYSGRGLIFYIHGGGFVSCSPGTHRPITTALARRSGLKVFSIDYRRAPEHRFPAALDDVFEGYKWLLEQGVRGNDIALAGDSAGGGLVMSLMLRIREGGLEMPARAVGFSPWANLTPRADDCRNSDVDVMFYPENVAEFARAYLGDAPASDPLASPVFADLSGLPPVLLQVSSTEILLDDSERIHRKIQEAGGASEIEIFDSLSHCWQMLNWFEPEAGRALDRAAEFITLQMQKRERR